MMVQQKQSAGGAAGEASAGEVCTKAARPKRTGGAAGSPGSNGRRASRARPPPAARITLTDIDLRLAESGAAKVQAGVPPNRQERRALKQITERIDQCGMIAIVSALPRDLWQEWAGVGRDALRQQARTYGLPFGSPRISLPAVVRALHDFLARHAAALREAMLRVSGNAAPADEAESTARRKQAQAILAEIDVAERTGKLIAREDVRSGLQRVAAVLRDAAEEIERGGCRQCAATLLEAIDDAEHLAGEIFNSDDGASARAEVSKTSRQAEGKQ